MALKHENEELNLPKPIIPKIDVLMTILKRLDSGEKITVGQLAQELSVTERSIYRYLETLQAAGYPIYFDHKLKSYRFVESYKLQNSNNSKEILTALDLKQQMLRSSTVGIAAYNINGSCVLVNSALSRMTNVTRQQLFAQNFRDLQSWRESGLIDLVNNALEYNEERSQDIHLHSTSGKELWAHCIVTPFQRDEENFIFVMAHDISARKQHELALSSFASSISKGPSLLMITDVDGTIEYVSDKITEITGYSCEEVIGANPRIFKSNLTPASVYKNMWETITGGLEWTGELCNRRKSGSTYWEHICISPIFDADGSIKRFVAVKEDVTRHKQLEDELYRHATSDSLTGLYNRRMTIELASREIDLVRRHKGSLATVIVDIDHLKKINHDHGHAAGDEVIRAVSRVCRYFVRSSDILGRTGNDEFTVVLTGVDADTAEELAQRLLKGIEELHIAWNSDVIHCTASIGITMLSNDDSRFETLLEQSGQAARKANRNAKAQIELYKPDAEPGHNQPTEIWSSNEAVA